MQLKKKNIKRKNTLKQRDTKFTIMDLVKIFSDEAYKICKNKALANSIALESLMDYVRKHVKNINILL